jgi:hypothetical protein
MQATTEDNVWAHINKLTIKKIMESLHRLGLSLPSTNKRVFMFSCTSGQVVQQLLQAALCKMSDRGWGFLNGEGQEREGVLFLDNACKSPQQRSIFCGSPHHKSLQGCC